MVYVLQGEESLAGETYSVELLYDGAPDRPGPEGAGWMVELPAVLAMLRACDRTGATTADVHAALTRLVASCSARSGCCPECDAAGEAYAAALEEYEVTLAEQQQAEAALTPESHPFIVSSSGKVHAWNCHTNPGTPAVVHPGKTLQQFVHDGRMFNGVRYRLRSEGSAVRMSAAELRPVLSP